MLVKKILRKLSSQDVCIVGFGRGPIGQYGGILKGISSIDLASQVCLGTIEKYSIPKSLIESSYTGVYLYSDLGPSPTKQIATKIGLPDGLNCTYTNKLCASSLKAVMQGVIEIRAEESKLLMACGFEHMTEAFHGLSKEAQRQKIVTTYKCLIENKMLAEIADLYAIKRGITREEQDDYALKSLNRAQIAKAEKKTANEIIPIKINENIIDEDEIKDYSDNVRSIRTLYKNGTITTITTAPFGDQASFLFLCTRKEAENMGLRVYASVLGLGEHETNSADFLIAHYKAIEKALNKARLKLSDIQLFEVAETFAILPIVTIKDLGLDESIVNIHGGDLVYGHPIGATGAKMVIAMINGLNLLGKEIGMVTMPGACGGGTAVIIKRE